MPNKEIIATLEKPYTENQRMDFIVEYNHNQGCEIEELEDKTLQAFKIVKTPEELAQEEQNRINHLTCTALDIVTLIKTLGLTDTEILQFLNDNPSIQLQLTLCKDVYCGVVRQLCPLKISDTVTLTDEMVVSFFKKKHNIV